MGGGGQSTATNAVRHSIIHCLCPTTSSLTVIFMRRPSPSSTRLVRGLLNRAHSTASLCKWDGQRSPKCVAGFQWPGGPCFGNTRRHPTTPADSAAMQRAGLEPCNAQCNTRAICHARCISLARYECVTWPSVASHGSMALTFLSAVHSIAARTSGRVSPLDGSQMMGRESEGTPGAS